MGKDKCVWPLLLLWTLYVVGFKIWMISTVSVANIGTWELLYSYKTNKQQNKVHCCVVPCVSMVTLKVMQGLESHMWCKYEKKNKTQAQTRNKRDVWLRLSRKKLTLVSQLERLEGKANKKRWDERSSLQIWLKGLHLRCSVKEHKRKFIYVSRLTAVQGNKCLNPRPIRKRKMLHIWRKSEGMTQSASEWDGEIPQAHCGKGHASTKTCFCSTMCGYVDKRCNSKWQSDSI